MTTAKNIRRVALVAASSAALSLSACGPEKGPVVFVVADTSPSTSPQRLRGGRYEKAVMKALTWAAAEGGEVYVTGIAGNAAGAGGWAIDTEFRQRVAGNDDLTEAARVNAAKQLLPRVRKILKTGTAEGSDALLGGLQQVALTAKALPQQRRKLVVALSDGAAVTPEISFYRHPPKTPHERKSLVQRLLANGELPPLKGLEVHLVGVGLGIRNRTTARSAIEFWQAAITGAGRSLKATDSTLHLPARATR